MVKGHDSGYWVGGGVSLFLVKVIFTDRIFLCGSEN